MNMDYTYPGVMDDEDEDVEGKDKRGPGPGGNSPYPAAYPNPAPTGPPRPEGAPYPTPDMAETPLGGMPPAPDMSGASSQPSTLPSPATAPNVGGYSSPEPSHTTAMTNTVGPRPVRADYNPPPLHGWKKWLGPAFVGMAAMSPNDPQAGQRAYNEMYVAPGERAEKRFDADTANYEKRVSDTQKQTEEQRLQGQATSTQELQRSEEEKNRAQADKLGRDTKNEAAPTITIGEGPASKTMQWNPDTKRYDIEVGPGGKSATSGNEEERFFQAGVKDGKWGNDAYGRESAHRAYANAGRDPSVGADRRANMDERAYEHWSKTIGDLRKPYAERIDRLSRLNEGLTANNPQADALVAPELLSVMAGGQGSGIRMSEAELQRIVNGKTNLEKLKSVLNAWSLDPSKPFLLTPAQRQQAKSLMDAVAVRTNAKLQMLDDASHELLEASGSGDIKQYRGVYTKLQGRLTSYDQDALKSSGAGLPQGLPDVATGNKGKAIPNNAKWRVNGKVVAIVKEGQWQPISQP